MTTNRRRGFPGLGGSTTYGAAEGAAAGVISADVDQTEYRSSSSRQWTPPSDITIHQFVLRLDGEGAFLVTESDDPAAAAREIAKFSPFLEYTIYPVLDVAEGAAVAAEAVEWRKSIT
jgi:hypothetical protein